MSAGHIGIVIAGYDGDICRWAQHFKPAPCGFEFFAQGDVGKVAGDDDMVGIVCPHVGLKAIEALRRHFAGAVEAPVGVADQPF